METKRSKEWRRGYKSVDRAGGLTKKFVKVSQRLNRGDIGGNVDNLEKMKMAVMTI